MDRIMGAKGVTMFLRTASTDRPHSAKEVSPKQQHAHATKERNMTIVLPERTAPSQMIA